MYGRTYIVEDEKFNKSLIPTFAAALNEKLNKRFDASITPSRPRIEQINNLLYIVSIPGISYCSISSGHEYVSRFNPRGG